MIIMKTIMHEVASIVSRQYRFAENMVRPRSRTVHKILLGSVVH